MDRSSLGVVRVSGPDRLTWLTSIASQILSDMKAGDSREFLLLTPQGRIEYAPAAIEDGEALWLIVEGDQAEPLTEYLNRMKFMLRVEIQNLSDEYAVLESARNPILQDGSVHPALAEGKPLVGRPWNTPAPGGYRYDEAGDAHPGADYVRFWTIVPRGVLNVLAENREDVRLAGVWLPRPCASRLGALATLPKWMIRAFRRSWITPAPPCTSTRDATRGRETVARVHNLGRPPRRLVFLDIDGSGAHPTCRW